MTGGYALRFQTFSLAQVTFVKRALSSPPAGTDYYSCQVSRKIHLFWNFIGDTGPETKSADRDQALLADFFIYREGFD